MTERLLPFHKIMFIIRESDFHSDDEIFICVQAENCDKTQFIIPFKTISEIREFSDGLLVAIAEIKETNPEFAKRNE
jgi:hypothetical protein